MAGDNSRSSSVPGWFAATAIVAVAAVLRLAALDLRPVHFDEGVNGWFVDGMVQQGFYHYDPSNFHGPLHFYALFISQTLFGRNLWALRLPTAMVSIACVVLVFAFRSYFSRRACTIAALFMALSPGMVFYGRDAIHETWLVFFLLLSLWGLIGLWSFGERKHLWATALGLAGAIVTKETYLIHLIALALAAASLLALHGGAGPVRLPARQTWRGRDLSHCALVSVGAIIFFYTGGFLDWPDFSAGAEEPRGSLAGMYETFLYWGARGVAGETGHEKPWYYWWDLMTRYEWPALAGLLGGLFLIARRMTAFRRVHRKEGRIESAPADAVATARHAGPASPLAGNDPRFLSEYIAFYAAAAFIAYTIIPYKTPWCLIAIIAPFYLLFGIGLEAAIRTVDRYVFASGGLVFGLIAAISTWELNFRNFADEAEPYAYVQTLPEVERLLTPLRTLVERDPANYHLLGYVMTPDHHPLPWLLGDFPRIELYDPGVVPEPADADFLLIDETQSENIERQLRDAYFKEPLRLRGNAADSSMLYLRVEKFRVCFPAREPEFMP